MAMALSLGLGIGLTPSKGGKPPIYLLSPVTGAYLLSPVTGAYLKRKQ